MTFILKPEALQTRSLGLSAICCLILFAAVPLKAQDNTDAVDRTLPNITVYGIVPEDINNTPGAATRLTDEQMEAFRPYTLHDALDFTPGVRTIDDDVLGRRSGIGIRGAPSRRSRKTLLLEDGAPINGTSYLDPSAHYTPPMDRLEAIDVLKGTGHVVHGPLNNHGIINFRTKRATETPQTDIDLSAGSNDTYKGHIMHRRTEGDVGIVLSYTGLHADGVFDIEETEYHDVFGSVDWEINDKHNLYTSFLYFRETSNGYDESNLLPAEFERSPDNKGNRLITFGGETTATGWGQQHHEISVEYFKLNMLHNFQITDNLSMANRVFAHDLARPRLTVDPEEIEFDPDSAVLDFDAGGGLPFLAGVQGEMVGRERLYRTYGVESRMEYANLNALGLNHNLLWGVRYERQLQDDRRGGGEEGEILDFNNRGTLTRDVELQGWATSFFIKDAIEHGDWTITPGVRVEYYEQKRHRQFIAEHDERLRPTLTTDRTLALPSISFFYDGFEQTQVFANVGRGYTPGFARTADSDDFPLKPETGINSQVGLRSSAIKGVTLEFAGFYNIINNTIVQLPFTSDFQNIYINAADSESYGMDLGLRFDSNAHTDSAYNWYSEIAYNYTLAEFTEDPIDDDGNRVPIDGNRVPEIPKNAGSFTLGLAHDSGWDISATISHFGSFFTDLSNTQALTVANEDGEILAAGDELEIREPIVLGRVPSHTLLSARASYTPANMDNVTFWVQGRNLTDKLYIVDLENGMRPGAELTVTGGVRFSF